MDLIHALENNLTNYNFIFYLEYKIYKKFLK